MASKKEILSRIAAYSGATWLLESLPGRPRLLILNYHRIGDPAKTPYDPGLFSCTAEELSWQTGWLKQRFPILTLGEAVDIVHGRARPSGTSVLLTFDDGYRDNYDEAFPVFQQHGVSATFFLPTQFVGTGKLPWWDEIAYMVKRTGEARLQLSYPKAAEFELPQGDRGASIVQVLNFFKGSPDVDTERFLTELETVSGVKRPDGAAERCFMSWDEARAMEAGGMCFGSHTHTHEILGRLPYPRQLEELTTSRRILEAELGHPVDTLAYPVGKQNTFSADTFRALEEARYGTAFSFYSGVNSPGAIQRFDVKRTSVDSDSRPRFRLRNALYATVGRGVV
jgi:peptidoglycan/xylan/chitin deacetylase (PgdA/CDA1 family)